MQTLYYGLNMFYLVGTEFSFVTGGSAFLPVSPCSTAAWLPTVKAPSAHVTCM